MIDDLDSLPAADEQPVQARPWRKLAGVATATGVVVGAGMLYLSVSAEPPKKAPAPIAATIGEVKFPELKFEAPVSPPPQPAALPVPSPPAPPPAPPAAEAKALPPPPAPKAVSVFQTVQDDGTSTTMPAGLPRMPGIPGGPPPALGGEYRPGTDNRPLGDENTQGLAGWKNDWLANAGNRGKDFVTTPFSPPIGRYMLQAGVLLPAITVTAINSDLPGDMVAMISRDVYDTPTGDTKLIPVGSRLYFTYANQLAFAQERAQIACTRILFPDGSSQNLGAMAGVDDSGASGVEGDVDSHPWGMAGAVGLSALLSIVGQTGQIVQATQGGNSGATGVGIIAGGGLAGAGQASDSIGSKIIQKQLNRPNTLRIPPGTQLAVMLNKDVALPPWADHGSIR